VWPLVCSICLGRHWSLAPDRRPRSAAALFGAALGPFSARDPSGRNAAAIFDHHDHVSTSSPPAFLNYLLGGRAENRVARWDPFDRALSRSDQTAQPAFYIRRPWGIIFPKRHPPNLLLSLWGAGLSCWSGAGAVFWRTRLGYEIAPSAIPNPQHFMQGSATKITVVTMMILSACAGGDWDWRSNNVHGEAEKRLVAERDRGARALIVSRWPLMVRSHPFASFWAAILVSGFLSGAAAENCRSGPISRASLIIVIQALVIPVHRAWDNMVRLHWRRIFMRCAAGGLMVAAGPSFRCCDSTVRLSRRCLLRLSGGPVQRARRDFRYRA